VGGCAFDVDLQSGSYLSFGVVHTLNQTDVAAQNQESTSVFATLNHRITPKLTGSFHGLFQYSAYDSDYYDGRLTCSTSWI